MVEIETETEPSTQDRTEPEVPIRCKRCGARLVSAGNASAVKGEHTFRNPAGYSFHVVVFCEVEGVRFEGPAVAEASWFEGYSWRIALCDSCSSHLGWGFESEGALSFVGLIATRLTGLA